MEEEGVPSTALREVSLLQMLSESAFIVRYARRPPSWTRNARLPPKTAIETCPTNGFFKRTGSISRVCGADARLCVNIFRHGR